MNFILFFLFLFSYSFACVFLDVDVFNKGFQESEQILNTHFLLHFGFSSVLGKRVREKTGEGGGSSQNRRQALVLSWFVF